MVTWKRKVQIQDEQARITLPKRWVEEQGIQDKDKLEIKQMKRESALKLKLPE